MVSTFTAFTVVAVVTAVLFAGAGLAKLLSAPMSLEMRDALEVSPQLWKTIGVLEVVGALAIGGTLLGFVPPRLGAAAAVGFVLLILGAILTRIRRKSPPGLILADLVTLTLAVLTLNHLTGIA